MNVVLLQAKAVEMTMIDQPIRDKEKALSIQTIVKNHAALLGINGGYFDDQFRPDGWCVIDGKEITVPLKKTPLSGVLYLRKKDSTPHLEFFEDRIPDVEFAVQTGPFIIDPGGAKGIRKAGGPLARRTVLAQTKKSWLIITTTPVTLYDLAVCLDMKGVSDEKIDRALNFDGGPSTGIFLQSEDVILQEAEFWPVRNVLLFKKR